jgi:hypothetical protein
MIKQYAIFAVKVIVVLAVISFIRNQSPTVDGFAKTLGLPTA